MAIVGLEESFYQISEDVGVVKVCTVVNNASLSCPIDYSFEVELSTKDGSAGKCDIIQIMCRL